MPAQSVHKNSKSTESSKTVVASRARHHRVVACIDETRNSLKVVPHGVAVANALGAELVLVRVIEPRPNHGTPSDPLEWELRRCEARDCVEKLARERANEIKDIRATVLEGWAADQICNWVGAHQVDLTVLSSHGVSDPREWEMGSAARRLIDCVPGSVLLVPAQAEECQTAHYRRLMVPLDGSSRAESAIPLALRLANAHKAELLPVHVVPEPELTEIGPLEPQDMELREQLMRRNRRVAQDYMDRIHARIAEKGVSVRTLVLRDGDVRHMLSRSIVDEAADLVVVAAQGRSGHVDVAIGNVTAYLIGHARTPILVVRDRSVAAVRRGYTPRQGAGIRLPSQATL